MRSEKSDVAQKLTKTEAEFATATIQVIDESHQHIGHAGYRKEEVI